MIRRLNHAVLWVRDAQRSAEFYTTVLGFEAVATMGSQAVFLRADGSTNDHDLGLFSVGDRPQPPPQSPGLYHLAWQVNTIEDLAALRAKLVAAGSLVGESDHGVSKSLYAARSRRDRVRGDVGSAEGELAIGPVDRAARSRCRTRSMGSGRHRRSVARCH